jgi:hypothetical protein
MTFVVPSPSSLPRTSTMPAPLSRASRAAAPSRVPTLAVVRSPTPQAPTHPRATPRATVVLPAAARATLPLPALPAPSRSLVPPPSSASPPSFSACFKWLHRKALRYTEKRHVMARTRIAAPWLSSPPSATVRHPTGMKWRSSNLVQITFL